MKWFLFSVFAATFSSAHLSAQIYADFETSLGNFTCELNYTASPQTVANFVGLAEGSRAWIDPASGAVRSGTPFYDGLTFHRVIDNFMNQSGSRNGLGTDGPGYSFRDETSNGLNHSAPYMLSMANSGAHTNGSQFFITAVPTTWLDGIHTVFGAVITGQSVIDTINNVATVEDKPVTPVVIQSVKIRRVGAAAEAFDIGAQALPLVTASKGNLEVQPGVSSRFNLSSPRNTGTVSIFRSENLQTWSNISADRRYIGPGVEGPTLIPLDTATLSKAFYQVAEVSYSDALGPSSLAGRTMNLTWGSGAQTLTVVFDAEGDGGTFTFTGGTTPVTITSVDATFNPHTSSVTIYSSINPIGIDLVYNSQSATSIVGTHTIYQYRSSGWASLGNGPATVTK